jgi:flagellar protein FlaJ
MVRFEMLVSRGVARGVSHELDLAGMKITVETLLRMAIVGFFALFVISIAVGVLVFNLYAPIAGGAGLGIGAVYVVFIYMILEYRIENRKTRLEEMLPDYLQITSANLRSGIALDRAMLLSARPEFGFLSDEIKDMNKRIYSGENFDNALHEFANRYRSFELTHAVRMMVEALRYGGAMADLIEQIAKSMRNNQLVQKEITGQLFMYSIFIAFAGLIAAPVLYGLTSQMIVVTDTIWKGILASSPGGIPNIGMSFLKPSAPKISSQSYYDFSLISIMVITGFASLIMSAISSGSAVKGLRYLPIFLVLGIVIFLVMQHVIASVFASIGGGVV